MCRASIRSLLLVLTACAAPSAEVSEQLERPPNLVLIVTDDQGWWDVGFNGCTDIPTPNIDRIAREGVRFSDGYVTDSVCGPSRAGLITGRYQDRFGASRNPTIDPSVPDNGVPRTERNLAELLGPRGYKTMAVGKWHLGTHPDLVPSERGFDEFYGFLSGGHRYFPEQLTLEDLSEVDRPWAWYQTKLLHNVRRVSIDEYLTDALSSAAVEFVERTQDSPFFLYLAYNAPHTPLQAPPEYLERLQVESVDAILLDLGLSSDQLADMDRGFSFNSDGPLDLRFDVTAGEPAWRLINRLGEKHLADLIYQYGEERFSRRIARKICRLRHEQPIKTADQLAQIVRSCIPRSKRDKIDPATRTFQAFRIAVNEELKWLGVALKRLPDCLAVGGKFAIISFHSLEDRMVKTAFSEDRRLKVLTKRPLIADAAEIADNPRSRSAKLRIAERVSVESGL